MTVRITKSIHRKYRTQRFKMLKKEKSKKSHTLLTAGASQPSTVLKQTGNTAPAAGFSLTPLR